MGVFDVAHSIVSSAAGVIVGNTAIDITSVFSGLEAQLESMDLGPLLGL